MPDVLKIAIERRETLMKEVAALNRFITTANELLAQASVKAAPAQKPRVALKPAPLPGTSKDAAQQAGSQTEAFLKARQATIPPSKAKTG